MTGRVIYPARRAVEHAVTVSGVRPARLFAVLWPLWQVEITADVQDEQAYEVIDRFLTRAVAEGGIDSAAELSRFFGLHRSLVDRCLAFLTVIGHITADGERIRLTELGMRSMRADVRYVAKESRQKLLIERFTGRPLPRRHYDGSIAVLTTPEVGEDQVVDRTRFRPLFAPMAFQPRMITDLASRPDRTEYNLPRRLQAIRDLKPQDAYLPAYIIETADRSLLAYTAVSGERDTFLEGVCRDVPDIHARIEAERRVDPRQLWTAWLAESGLGHGVLQELPHGVWRAVLGKAAFSGPPKLPLSRLGSFQLRDNHFLQLWCEDRELRQRAVQERSLRMSRQREVRTQADLTDRMTMLAWQLEVAAPTIASLRPYAEKNGMHNELAHLDALD
ncbi:hypothetical protein [Planotetraspora sp. GP83]|uniref:hypothetical protein n=1 Tax=Planotetraspora sp. GP83 TaxID=3156264 RepID=UPI00351868ED